MNFSLLKNLFILIAIIFSFIDICMSASENAPKSIPTSIQQKLADLEAAFSGRLGVYAVNTANNMRIQYRADERFPFCSTYKVIGVSAILKKSMPDPHFLQEKIIYPKEDVVVYSPITEQHIKDGMSIADLCAAAIMYSDNTAINLLLKKLGGLDAVTRFARSIGDNQFRLERWEPNLNSAIPGDLRETSTPLAMEKDLQQLILGDALAFRQRQLLQTWLKNNTTGNARIRAGVPKNWLVADKTGTGDYGTTNDIGIIWPTNCKPIIVAIYFTQNQKNAAPRNEVIASATRMLVDEFARVDPCINLNKS